MIVALALKNLRRNLRRTLIAEASIVFGVFVVLFVGNFIDGLQQAWAQYEVEAGSGAFQFEDAQYRELRKSQPLKVTLADAGDLIERIRHVPGVRAAYGRLAFSGMVSNGLKATYFDGVAVDPAQQAATLPRQEELIVGGRALGAQAGGIVLGADLAGMLDLKIGDPVTVVVRTYHGGLNLMRGTLVGIKNGRHFPSSTYLEMPLAESQALLRVRDRVSQVVVATHELAEVPATMQRVSHLLASEQRPVRLIGYPELIPIYAQAIALFQLITLVIGLVLFVLVGAGVGNVMAMAVMERKHEIGALRALGMERRTVRRLFLAEGAVVGALGATVGLLLVTALTAILASRDGLHVPGSGSNSHGMSIIPSMDPLWALLGLTVPAAVALLGSWWPAARAAALSPVEALTETQA